MREGRFAKGMKGTSLRCVRNSSDHLTGISMVFGWTQGDGATNAGPGHLIQTEEDMIRAIKQFSHAMTPAQFSTLFSLYPSSDFEEEKLNYDSRKSAEDPVISVDYFRVSKILGDILFTCSSIEYGYHMMKHTSQSIDPDFLAVRLYSLNQSMLTPLFRAGGMPYLDVPHGSDTNYIFNGVFPEGEINEEDKQLSELFARSFINFAYTGNPISTNTSQKQFAEWPTAYSHS